jgi:hypothetical protein
MSRHATDVVSLVFGLIFAGLAVNWVLIVTDVSELSNAQLTVPVILIAAGIAGLVSVLARGGSQETSHVESDGHSAPE